MQRSPSNDRSFYLVRLGKNDDIRNSVLIDGNPPVELQEGAILGRNVSNVSKEVNPKRLDIGIQRIADGVSRECFEVKEMTKVGLRLLVVPYTKNKMEFLVKGLRYSAAPGTEQLLQSGDKIVFDAFCKPPLYSFVVASSREVREVLKEKLLRNLKAPEESAVPLTVPNPLPSKQKKKTLLDKVLNRTSDKHDKERRSDSIPKVVIQWDSNHESKEEEIFSNSAYSSDSTYSSGLDELSISSMPSSSSGHSTASTDFEVKVPRNTSKYLRSDYFNYGEYGVVRPSNGITYSDMYGEKAGLEISSRDENDEYDIAKKRGRNSPQEEKVLLTPENRDAKRYKPQTKQAVKINKISPPTTKQKKTPLRLSTKSPFRKSLTQRKETESKSSEPNQDNDSFNRSKSTPSTTAKLQIIDIVSRSVEKKKVRAKSESPLKRVERNVNKDDLSKKNETKNETPTRTVEIVSRNIERNRRKRRESKATTRKTKKNTKKALAPPKAAPQSTTGNFVNADIAQPNAKKIKDDAARMTDLQVHSIPSNTIERELENPDDHVSIVSNLSTEGGDDIFNPNGDNDVLDDASIETRDMPDSIGPTSNHYKILYNLKQTDTKAKKNKPERSLADKLNALDSKTTISNGVHKQNSSFDHEQSENRNTNDMPAASGGSKPQDQIMDKKINGDIFIPTNASPKSPESSLQNSIALSLQNIDTASLEQEILRRLKLTASPGEKNRAKSSLDTILSSLDAEVTPKKETANAEAPLTEDIYSQHKVDKLKESSPKESVDRYLKRKPQNKQIPTESDKTNFHSKEVKMVVNKPIESGSKKKTIESAPQKQSVSTASNIHADGQTDNVQTIKTAKKRMNIDLLLEDGDSSDDSDESCEEDTNPQNMKYHHLTNVPDKQTFDNPKELNMMEVKEPALPEGIEVIPSSLKEISKDTSPDTMLRPSHGENDNIDHNKRTKTPTVIRLRETRHSRSFDLDSDSDSEKGTWKRKKKGKRRTSKDRFEFLEEIYAEEDDESIVSSLCYPEHALNSSLDVPLDSALPRSLLLDTSDLSDDLSFPNPSAPAFALPSSDSDKGRSIDPELQSDVKKKKESISEKKKQDMTPRDLKKKSDEKDVLGELALNCAKATEIWTKETGKNINQLSKDIGDNMGKIMKEMAENIEKWSKEMGEKIVIMSKEAGEQIAKGSKIAGEQIVKGSKIAGEQIVKGSKIAGEQIVKFSKESGTFIVVKSKEFGEKAGPIANEMGENIVKTSKAIGENVVKTSKSIGENIAKTTKETDEKVRPMLKDWGQKTTEFSVATSERVLDFFANDKESAVSNKKDNATVATTSLSDERTKESEESVDGEAAKIKRAPTGDCTFCVLWTGLDKNYQPRISSENV